jgi:hypothetical protein
MGEINAEAKASETDPFFEGLLKKLRSLNEKAWEALSNAQQSAWLMPDLKEWSGDLFDIEGIAEAFKRDKANEQFNDATTDAKSPGVTGDLIVTTLQIAYMEAAERAFRCRHTVRRPRAVMQAMGRLKGHGNNQGTLIQTLEYIRRLMQESKSKA